MTVVNPKSISGINSITTGSGSDDILTIHTNNGTERLRVDSTGATKIVTGIVTTLTATTGIVTTLTTNTTTHLSDVSFTGASYNMTWDKSDNSLIVNDNARVKFGTGKDLHIYHNESNSVIREEGTGNLNLQTTGGNVEILTNTTETSAKFISDGAVELYYDNSKKFNTNSEGVSVHGNLALNAADNYKIYLGAGNDLQIYHDGSHTYANNTTGFFHIRSGSAIRLQKSDGEPMIYAIPDGAVELYHDNSKKLETQSFGATVTGTLQATGNIELFDNGVLNVGTGADLKIYHDGSNSRLKNTTGSIWIQSDTGIRFTDADVNESMAAFYDNGAVELYYDGTKKFETYNDGVKVTGVVRGTTSGFGIDFAETSNTGGMTSEVLDDYEEGTFTPTLGGQLSGQSYTTQVGQYTKIGNVVVANVYLKLAGDPGSYASGINIGGLPFTGINNNALAGAGVLAYQAGAFPSSGTNANFSAMVNSNDTVMKLYTPDGTFLLWNEMNNRTEQMRFNITYRTA